MLRLHVHFKGFNFLGKGYLTLTVEKLSTVLTE